MREVLENQKVKFEYAPQRNLSLWNSSLFHFQLISFVVKNIFQLSFNPEGFKESSLKRDDEMSVSP